MLSGFVGGIFTAWVLSWFNVDNMIADFFLTTCNFVVTPSIYYIGFGIVGLLGGAFRRE